MASVAIQVLSPGHGCFFLLVLVPGFHPSRPELLHVDLLDSAEQCYSQPSLWYEKWYGARANHIRLYGRLFRLRSSQLIRTGAQIAYIGSPLVVPTWVTMNVLASLVLWIFIVCPALYYSNTWYSAYLPFQSNSVFDDHGKIYNVSRVINKVDDFTFDLDKFESYSDVRLPFNGAGCS